MVTQFAFGTDLAQIGTMSDIHSEDKTLFEVLNMFSASVDFSYTSVLHTTD